MKSSASAEGEMKAAFLYPPKGGLHRAAISSTLVDFIRIADFIAVLRTAKHQFITHNGSLLRGFRCVKYYSFINQARAYLYRARNICPSVQGADRECRAQ